MDHVVIVDGNHNSFENHLVDNFHIKNDFSFLKEVF